MVCFTFLVYLMFFKRYFEWKTSKDGKKQPFFIYFPIKDNKEMAQDLSQIKSELVDSSSEDHKLKIKEDLEEKNHDAHKLADSEIKENNEELKDICEIKRSFGGKHHLVLKWELISFYILKLIFIYCC